MKRIMKSLAILALLPATSFGVLVQRLFGERLFSGF